jgi:large conductance mechanosensitive channel
MGFVKEFKQFALKGNVMDMAVGVIIGGAFGKIVTSLVNDILMPPIGVLMGNVSFADLKLNISRARDAVASIGNEISSTMGAAAQTAPQEPVYWCYGAFIQQCIDFLILAFCVFLMVKFINHLTTKKEIAAPPVPPAPSKEEQLLAEIRDLLKNQQNNRK